MRRLAVNFVGPGIAPGLELGDVHVDAERVVVTLAKTGVEGAALLDHLAVGHRMTDEPRTDRQVALEGADGTLDDTLALGLERRAQLDPDTQRGKQPPGLMGDEIRPVVGLDALGHAPFDQAFAHQQTDRRGARRRADQHQQPPRIDVGGDIDRMSATLQHHVRRAGVDLPHLVQTIRPLAAGGGELDLGPVPVRIGQPHQLVAILDPPARQRDLEHPHARQRDHPHLAGLLAGHLKLAPEPVPDQGAHMLCAQERLLGDRRQDQAAHRAARRPVQYPGPFGATTPCRPRALGHRPSPARQRPRRQAGNRRRHPLWKTD
jgi:hypothetical protein